MSREQLMAACLELPEEERAVLAEALLASFSTTGPQAEDDLAVAEVRRRKAAYEAGQMQAVPMEEALERIRQQLG